MTRGINITFETNIKMAECELLPLPGAKSKPGRYGNTSDSSRMKKGSRLTRKKCFVESVRPD